MAGVQTEPACPGSKAALPPAIFLMGPTASGKTDLAMRLHDAFPCEIISVDSALVYRGMDIGTAKPSLIERARYPHHLIDIIDPAQSYSAAQFRTEALALMADAVARGKVPLLVGGTMMYFRVLLHGIAALPDADPGVRAAIVADAAAHGWGHVHRQLAAVDPVSAARINPNDPQRLQRALEVFRVTGVSMTAWREQESRQELPYRLLQLAVAPADRAVLHRRIAHRFTRMLAQGFEQEVRRLRARPDLHAGLPSIRSVGYRQMWSYLEGEYDFAHMQEQAIIATRQLAKRQLTWLRSWQDLDWIYTDNRHEGITGSELAAIMLPATLNLVKKRLNLPL